MQSSAAVEVADRYSRKRAVVVAAAALGFIVIYAVLRPFVWGGWDTAQYARSGIAWAINAAILLVVLATGGGIFNSRWIRVLVNDEVAKANYRTAVVAGFWVAMATAIGLYVVPGFAQFTGRDAIYVIVTASLGIALLAFSYLEYRAHRDE